jgi:hypothetical protein
MKVHVNPDDVDTYKADGRGRITLGAEYSDEEVEVAIVDGDDD